MVCAQLWSGGRGWGVQWAEELGNRFLGGATQRKLSEQGWACPTPAPQYTQICPSSNLQPCAHNHI